MRISHQVARLCSCTSLHQCLGPLLPTNAMQSVADHSWLGRRLSTKASTSDDQPRKAKKPYNPDAWRARMPRKVEKTNSKLRREDPETYRRMRIILGYYDLPENKGKLAKEPPIQKVTVSHLQTLKYSPELGLDYKKDLLSYRIKTLNEGLHQMMEDPDLALPKPGDRKQQLGRAALAGFVPLTQPGASKDS